MDCVIDFPFSMAVAELQRCKIQKDLAIISLSYLRIYFVQIHFNKSSAGTCVAGFSQWKDMAA